LRTRKRERDEVTIRKPGNQEETEVDLLLSWLPYSPFLVPFRVFALSCSQSISSFPVERAQELHALIEFAGLSLMRRRDGSRSMLANNEVRAEEAAMETDRADPVIRHGRTEAAGELLELWRAAGATPSVTDTAEDVVRAILGGQACVLVAEVGGRIVESVIGGFDGWRGNMHRLAVHPKFRRQGIARALVGEAERWLAGQGAKRVTALVEHAHGLATGFWEGIGYEPDARIRRYRRDL
jgi:ribosomal protein S18 acetylase RimI-like enzyme